MQSWRSIAMREPADAALDLRELADLVHVHSGAQGLDRGWVDGVLAQIRHASGQSPDAWAPVWMREGAAAQARDDWSLALKLYNLGRFPYIGEGARSEAHALCLRASLALLEPRHARAPTTRVELQVRGHTVPFYLRRTARPSAPLLLVFGGIVSNKEQWLSFLDLADRLGMDVALAEYPGVGENRLPLDAGSHDMVGSILDAVQGPGQLECFLVALSFGGTLALRQAARDERIRGIATVGAPVRSFYNDVDWWQRIPSTTRLTLQHILNVPQADVFAHLAPLAVNDDELANVRIPVHYVQCAHDEIIHSTDAAELSAIAGPLRLLQVRDVHAAPHHLRAVRLFIVAAILRTMQPGSPRTRVLELAISLMGCLPALRLSTKHRPASAE